MATTDGTKPVGELKKIVSLIDRSDFDDYAYPSDVKQTLLQPVFQPYHVFTKEIASLPFSGNPTWGQRVTFEMPWPWQGDFLHSLTMRLKPTSWLTPEAYKRIGPDVRDWIPIDPENMYIWANSLGSIAIELAELELDGVIIESFSGDWINVWNRTAHSTTTGVPYDDAVYNSVHRPTVNRIKPSEDGYVYALLPFAFTRHINTALPLLSSRGPGTVRFHITLRPLYRVIQKLQNPLACDESPLSKTFTIRDYSFIFRNFTDVNTVPGNPGFEVADMLCEFSHIDGDLRAAYIERPHELYWNPVTETQFNEPLKYLVNTGSSDTIKISLPLTMANGPIRQILFFVRRTAAVIQFNDYTNYSAVLQNELDPIWNPTKPLLKHAQLQVGTAIFADEDEVWWRTTNLKVPGGVRAAGNYIYAYNFAESPYDFNPSGSANATRVDMRLNLTVTPPLGSIETDLEWTVTVFLVGSNWMRWQSGITNQLFMD